MKTWIIMVLLSVMVLVGVVAQEKQEEWKAPSRASLKKNPISSDEKSVAMGKELYTKFCEKCHGVGGKGDGPEVKKLNKKPGDLSSQKTAEQSDGALFWKITTGKKPMPTFREKLIEEQRWHVINYFRTFSKSQAKG